MDEKTHSPSGTGVSPGRVYLVGGGPGDPELLTLKAARLLGAADAVVYDNLVSAAVLAHASPGAELIYVGKKAGNHTLPQIDINQLLISLGRAGKQVVRLKGGDPMLFAHGGEEIEFLRSRFIKVEVVPGVTAALAAAAFANIPLTHRGISSSVTLSTGHAKTNIHVPESGTMVYYMGASNLHKIAEEVMRKGWNPETPVLLVYNASAPDQKEYYTTLQEVVDYPESYQTPLIIIIGEVVGLRTYKNQSKSDKIEAKAQSLLEKRVREIDFLNYKFNPSAPLTPLNLTGFSKGERSIL